MKQSSETEFIANLKHELISQPTDGNASPRFWVIAQQQRFPVPDEYAEAYELTHDDGDITPLYSVDDVLNLIENYIENDDDNVTHIYNDLKSKIDEGLTLDRMFDEIKNLQEKYPNEEFLSKFTEEPYAEVHTIKENTMFLTKKDAQEHLKFNKHHYNESAHTYAMTAFRSPAYSRLLCILTNPDLDITVSKSKTQEDFYQHFIETIKNQQDLNNLKKEYTFDGDSWPYNKQKAYIEFIENWDNKF